MVYNGQVVKYQISKYLYKSDSGLHGIISDKLILLQPVRRGKGKMDMKEYEVKLKNYIIENNIDAEQIIFTKSCHSVQEAADAVGASPEDLVKNICMIDDNDNLIVAIVKGEDRVSMSRVGKALNINMPRIANESEILEKTGYPCGGVPSFGYKATYIIDLKVLEKEVVYTGGGSPYSLVRITSKELQKANNGLIARVRK